MMRTVRSVLVTAWVGSTNLGDELVFGSLCRKLRARDVHITVVSTDPSATEREHDVHAIDHRNVPAFWRSLSSADAMLVGGGGLLQNATSAFNLPYHLARPVAARVHRRRVGAIGLGAGPLDGFVARRLVALGVAGVRPITVRDEVSRQVLGGIGVEARTAADLAFGLDPPSRVETDRLVVSLRPWSGRRHLLPAGSGRQSTPDWFAPRTASALDEIAVLLGVPVHFVALQRDRDHAVHEEVAGRMTTSVTFATPTVHDVLDEFARAVVVVSMRYHGVVAATLAGRPSVGIGYDPKVGALVDDVGAAARFVSWTPGGLASMAVAVEAVATADAVAAREQLRARELVNDVAIDEILNH